MVSDFCKEKLNSEYEQLCTKLIKKMGRKRECPFERGKLDIWAASVVHTIGGINFLYDKATQPYLPQADIHEYFGTKPSTVCGKANLIRRIMKLDRYFDLEFSTGEMNRINPMNQFVIVDGMLYPVSMLPEECQQLIREAREKGEDISFTTLK